MSLTSCGAIHLARSFAVIMGLLGMVTVLLRAVKDGSGLEGSVPQAVTWMLVLALVGAVVGAIAEKTMIDSVRATIEARLAATSEPEQTSS